MRVRSFLFALKDAKNTRLFASRVAFASTYTQEGKVEILCETSGWKILKYSIAKRTELHD